MVSRKQHPAELRERAVAMVFELRAETGSTRGTLARVGERLGINAETLRNWVERAEIDNGQRPGVTTDDRKRIAELPTLRAMAAADLHNLVFQLGGDVRVIPAVQDRPAP